MKKCLFSLLAALTLCLVQLPLSASAAEFKPVPEVKFIWGESLKTTAFLQPGMTYVPADPGGVKFAAAKPKSGWLMYESGVLTVCGAVSIQGGMEVMRQDLTIRTVGKHSSLTLNGDASNPGLTLGARHTLTLGPGLETFSVSSSAAGRAVGGGVIRCSGKETSIRINIAGAESGAVSGLTFKDCPDVQIVETSLENSSFTLDNSTLRLGIGNSVPAFSLDGTWKYGGESDASAPDFLNGDTCATCYRAGSGTLYYEPGDSPRLTLDGAAHTGDIDLQGASVQVVLKGQNQMKELRGKTVELTGNGNFTGRIETGGKGFTNCSTGKLNAVVAEKTGGSRRAFTIYGERSTADFSSSGTINVQEHTPVTIEKEAVLTIPAGEEMTISAPGSLTNKGTLMNNGTVILEGAAAQGSPAGTIKKLNLTGRGTVKAYVGNQPPAIYTNGGVLRLAPAGELDLSGAVTADESHWAGQGYKWEVAAAPEDGAISRTLTLAAGFHAAKVTLPDDEVNIVTKGESIIGELDGAFTKTKLTLSGDPLTIEKGILLTGVDNALTIEEGAEVMVYNGGSGCVSVGGIVTVNGALTADSEDKGVAVGAGKVSVGPKGVLKVSGQTGVRLDGMNSGSGGRDFAGAFSLSSGGIFKAKCSNTVITAATSSGKTPFSESRPQEIISLPGSSYLPAGCKLEFNKGKTGIAIPGGVGEFEISAKNLPPSWPGHRHAWAEAWTADETHHWHECLVSGCTAEKSGGQRGYGNHVYDGDQDVNCNVCGYTRTLKDDPEHS